MAMGREQPDAWYHGRITRENAAHLVMAKTNPEGYFLVRESLRVPGNYVLTMLGGSTVHHFQILGHGDAWFSVDNGPLFQGLDELVHHYQVQSDGLPQKLSDYVRGNQPPQSALRRLSTQLHKAVASNDFVTVKKLLSGPSSQTSGTVNSSNSEGQTPLHEAARKGYKDTLILLLEQKPDLSIRDAKGATPLHVSSQALLICIVYTRLV